MRFGAKFHINSQTNRPFKPYFLTKTKAFTAILCCLFPLIIGFALPVSRLAYWAILTVDKVSLISLLKLTFNSIGIASAASLVTVTIALILAFTSRYFRSQNVAVINRLAILGYAVPGAVIAMGILLVSGQVTKVTGIIFTGSLIVLVFAYVVRFLAVAWQPIDSGMERNCDILNEASRSLGSSVSRTLLQVNLPLVYNAIVVGALFVFVDTMKELPLTLILRPFNFETLSTRTFDLASQAQIPESSVPALCIIAVSLLPVIWLNRQMRTLKK